MPSGASSKSFGDIPYSTANIEMRTNILPILESYGGASGLGINQTLTQLPSLALLGRGQGGTRHLHAGSTVSLSAWQFLARAINQPWEHETILSDRANKNRSLIKSTNFVCGSIARV